MRDLLRVEANERVDLGDWRYMSGEGIEDNLRHALDSFATDPSGTRMWILDGFAISNPSGSQIQVTKGRAILGYREGGTVRYGALTTEGDATKIVDINSYSPGTYKIYIRFEYVDGDSTSRVFWDPQGLGSEIPQTIATRRKANWSMRIEATSPGAEWFEIGEVDQATVAIADKRKFFFEGNLNCTTLLGTWTWAGTTTVSATNTSQVSVGNWVRLNSDKQFFKITAINAGVSVTIENPYSLTIPSGATGSSYSSSPFQSGWSTEGGGSANDRKAVREDNGVGDLQTFTGAMRQCIEDIKGRGLRRWWDKGIGGLNVGFDADPTEKRLAVGDANYYLDHATPGAGSIPKMLFDAGDWLEYDRSFNKYNFRIASSVEMELSASKLTVNGAVFGTGAGTDPGVKGTGLSGVSSSTSGMEGVGGGTTAASAHASEGIAGTGGSATGATANGGRGVVGAGGSSSYWGGHGVDGTGGNGPSGGHGVSGTGGDGSAGNGAGSGIKCVGGNSTSGMDGYGVEGFGGGSNSIGVYGKGQGDTYAGVWGECSGVGAGVYGNGGIGGGYGVIGKGKWDPTTTGRASFKLEPQYGTPATLQDGAMWIVGTTLYVRLNGVTRTVNVT